MTDAECTVILAEFRKLTLGPELSAALDHAIGVLLTNPVQVERLRGGEMIWTPKAAVVSP